MAAVAPLISCALRRSRCSWRLDNLHDATGVELKVHGARVETSGRRILLKVG